MCAANVRARDGCDAPVGNELQSRISLSVSRRCGPAGAGVFGPTATASWPSGVTPFAVSPAAGGDRFEAKDRFHLMPVLSDGGASRRGRLRQPALSIISLSFVAGLDHLRRCGRRSSCRRRQPALVHTASAGWSTFGMAAVRSRWRSSSQDGVVSAFVIRSSPQTFESWLGFCSQTFALTVTVPSSANYRIGIDEICTFWPTDLPHVHFIDVCVGLHLREIEASRPSDPRAPLRADALFFPFHSRT